ncbi:hypothetical protein HYS48_00845 [Candidatus Woesearchaeota archaeon]|nr:hypothetical protein [Candidatus Woesearchaeota archaeon]
MGIEGKVGRISLEAGVPRELLGGRSLPDYEEAERTRFLDDYLREFYERGRQRDFFGEHAPQKSALREKTRQGLSGGIEQLLHDHGRGKCSIYQLVDDEFAQVDIESGRHFAAGIAARVAELNLPTNGVIAYATYMAEQYAQFLVGDSIPIIRRIVEKR